MDYPDPNTRNLDPGNDKFWDGVLPGNSDASFVFAQDLNAMYDEITNAIAASGQVPDRTKFDQLSKAVQRPEIVIAHRVAAGIHGGTYSVGAWRTAPLNSIEFDEITGVAVAGNQITGLPAGTYKVKGYSYMGGTDSHQARLRNVTDNVTLAISTFGQSTATGTSDTVGTLDLLDAKFTIAAGKTLELQGWGSQGVSNTGFGAGVAGVGEDHIFRSLNIKKVA